MLHKMLFIEHTRLNRLRHSYERGVLEQANLIFKDHILAAREARTNADYLVESIHYRLAADTYKESEQYMRSPLIKAAEECENLYKIFHELVKMIDTKLTFGKRMGDCVYIHASYKKFLPQVDLQQALGRLHGATSGAYLYNVIKWDRRSGCFTFIWSPDFLREDEPIVREWWTVPKNATQAVRFGQSGANPLIYHHKWQMVRYDCELFDVAESIKRSISWKRLPLHKDAYRKIGRLDYWRKNVVEFIEPVL